MKKKLTEKEVWLELARRWDGPLKAVAGPDNIQRFVPAEKTSPALLKWKKKMEARAARKYPSCKTEAGARERAEFCRKMAAECTESKSIFDLKGALKK